MFHNLKSQRTLDNSTVTLDNLNKNLLYVTHRVDAIYKEIHSLKIALALEKQASEYLDEYQETSHQTELEDK